MDKDADSPEGVFGNLLSTRPGSCSPRRRSTDAEAEAPAPEPAAPEPVVEEVEAEKPPVERVAGSDPSIPNAEGDQDAGEGSDPTGTPKSVEDLAWAGIAVAAQAATAGIRFTSKALEAARKSIDRP